MMQPTIAMGRRRRWLGLATIGAICLCAVSGHAWLLPVRRTPVQRAIMPARSSLLAGDECFDYNQTSSSAATIVVERLENSRSVCDDVTIRDCSHAELPQVADVIMASFYRNSTSPWKQLYRLGELNRVQQGFPYGDARALHRMLVATVPADKQQPYQGSRGGSSSSSYAPERIVGFLDWDARVPNRPTGHVRNPRPYLSDLCILPAYRRLGIAQRLVRAGEAAGRGGGGGSSSSSDRDTNQDEYVYIRVERHNSAAWNLYSNLGYREWQGHQDSDDVAKGAVLLRKHIGDTSIAAHQKHCE